jgi:hypothetical protein
VDEPPGRRLPRRLPILLAAVPLIAVLLADGLTVARRHAGTDTNGKATGVAQRAKPRPTVNVAKQRAALIGAMLAKRGVAVVHHDRDLWMSTIDPEATTFRRQQAREFNNLSDVAFASWSYSFDPDTDQVPSIQSESYDAPTWSPSDFSLRYRLRGFDTAPTNLAQYPTFVLRDGHWYLASLNDFAERDQVSSLDLWDFGPVRVLRTKRVLALGHPGSDALMSEVAAEVASDIPRVDRVWSRHWARRVVVLVPATQHELGVVVGDNGDLSHIAAVASAEVQSAPGKPNPVGDRIGINPANWPKLSPLGRQIVLTHELTHVATRAYTGAAAPSWLVEGFADYVGYLGSGVPATVAAQELAADVRAGRTPKSLPVDAQFNGASRRLAQAYEGAWMACRLIVARWGQRALDRFYATVGTSEDKPSVAVATAMESVLHTTVPGFVAAWRSYLRTQLS